jgi:lipopolysaccharide/colanic/teichoic acid biosynthesis glycosyltransferase
MYEARGKRLFDVLGAALLLVLTAPLLALAALLVLATLGRPVMFRQWRLGRGGVPFAVLKLRTMRDGRGEDSERLTGPGRVLRLLAIDELPQLVNVLRGEMSLVGPRPLPPAYRGLFTPEQAVRLAVRPGLCGLAQAAGRNAVPWSRRLALDARYVERISLAGDLAILVRCLGVIARGEGASAPGHATMPAFRGAVEP